MSVVAIVLQTDPRLSANTRQLLLAFSDPYFIARPFAPDDPSNDNMAYRQALAYAAALSPSLPCCIIRDSSVTNLGPEQMAQYVRLGMSYAPDMLFLTHWLDRCGRYKTVLASTFGGSALKQTFQPNATQCICYSAVARDATLNALATASVPLGPLLNSYLATGTMKAYTFAPNIVDMDINLITDNLDFEKLNECVLEPAGADKPGNRTAALVTFALIIVFTLIVAASLLRVSPPAKPVAAV